MLSVLGTAAADDAGPSAAAAVNDRQWVYAAPASGSARRGSVGRGMRLPVYRTERGSGCRTVWYEVHREGWLCGDGAVAGPLAPDAPYLPVLEPGELLPFPVAFVREGGAPLFSRLSDVEADYSERWLEKGYGTSVRRRIWHDGQRLYETASGDYVRASDVHMARPSTFRGVALEGREAIGWTYRASTRVYDRPPERGARASSRGMEARTLLRFVAETEVGGEAWLELEEGGFVRRRDVREVEYADPPAGTGPYDRWFDVIRSRQVLVAYEGARPAYATLISSGRAGHATPPGQYRIWVKLISGRMANEEPDDPEESPYYLEDVPWVMYFNDDIALHGAYWHSGFGQVRSHGCVNLSPIDARWVFEFASPTLPAGWWSILPTGSDEGSLVRVR